MNVRNERLDWSFLTQKQNYRPLNQRLRLYQRPLYAPDGEWDARTPFLTHVKRLVLGVAFLYGGYRFGEWDATDELLDKSQVVEFECEE